MHPSPHLSQQPAEGGAATVFQRGGILPFQRRVDLGGGQEVCAFLARLRKAETRADQFLGRRDAIEGAVGCLDPGLYWA